MLLIGILAELESVDVEEVKDKLEGLVDLLALPDVDKDCDADKEIVELLVCVALKVLLEVKKGN